MTGYNNAQKVREIPININNKKNPTLALKAAVRPERKGENYRI